MFRIFDIKLVDFISKSKFDMKMYENIKQCNNYGGTDKILYFVYLTDI